MPAVIDGAPGLLRRFVVLTLALFIALSAQAAKRIADYPVDAGALPAPLAKLLARARVPANGVGLYIQDVTQRKPLVVVNGNRAFNPASTMKALTTFIALDRLGPDFTWRTELYTAGRISNGILKGDLVLKGGGDPYLTTERLWKLLFGAKQRGLREIHGDLIIDTHYFDYQPPPRERFDGKPFRAYNAPPYAALLDFNATRFVLRPERAARSIRIITDPPLANLKIDNRMRFVDGLCKPAHRSIQMAVLARRGGGHVRFSGNYAAGCGETALTRVIGTNAGLVFGAVKSLWLAMGGKLTGKVHEAATPRSARRLVGIESRTLADVIRAINKYSNNVMVRQLLLTLGAEKIGRPGTPEKGRKVIKDWLTRWGADTSDLVVDNGAGLSRTARVTANIMGRFLHVAYASPLVTEFMSSLSVSGIDGTMKKRFRGQPLRGRAHIKTGLLDNVRAMSGYVLSRTGRRFIVVLLQNHSGAHYIGTHVQNGLLQWLFRQ